jgi:hypothetical protein
MKLPNQAQPVSRRFGASVAGSTDFRMLPSGDLCPPGKWCCNVGGNKYCFACTSTITIPGVGTRCTSQQGDDCAKYGGTPDFCG